MDRFSIALSGNYSFYSLQMKCQLKSLSEALNIKVSIVSRFAIFRIKSQLNAANTKLQRSRIFKPGIEENFTNNAKCMKI